MTVVPLPDIPCVRVRFIFNEGQAGEGGFRIYLSYSGSAPSGANCTTLAGDCATAFANQLVVDISNHWTLNEVDVLDIATNSGLSGQWTGTHTGQLTGQPCQAQVATNVEFGIARRYRGGKPRVFVPPPDVTRAASINTWTSAHVTDVNTDFAAMMAAITASSVGSMGTLNHVSLSYYSGFQNHANTSGRERAVPTYRATALHDNITSYSTKQIMGSQRRRRTSTTP